MPHTPGKWEKRIAFLGEYQIRASDGKFIGSVFSGKVDANLIAAAPRMLEVLKEASLTICTANIENRYTRADLVEIIDAAIAAAEGGEA